MAKILTLPPQAAPDTLTARRASKTLKDHEEAFKSINGYEVEPLPDPTTEINGIIAEIMKLQRVTHKEVQEGGRLIRIASEKKLRLNIGARMIWKAMGYIDFQDAQKRNEGKDYFENLNFDRKDLAAINNETNAAERAMKDKVIAHIRPTFERVFALPREKDWFKGERAMNTQAFMAKARPHLDTIEMDFNDLAEVWAVAHALAFRYPHASNMQTKKDMFRPKGFGSRKMIFEASKELARELGWGPKPMTPRE
jgi:hypothetical protein